MSPSSGAETRRRPTAEGGARLLYGGFFLVGIATVLLGPLIPELRARWDLSAADAARLFLAQFVASTIGSVLSTFDLRRSLILGYGLIAAGMAALPLAGWPMAQGAMFLIGLGLGLVAPATNVLVAQRNPTRRGAALTLVNLFWGLGAVSCLLIFAALLRAVHYGAIVGGLAAILAAVTLLHGRWRNATVPTALPGGALPDGAETPKPALKLLLLLALMFFVYVGAEIALGGWLVSLAGEFVGTGTTASMLIGAGFWGAFLSGRATTPLILRRVPETTVYALALVVATAGTAGIFMAPTRELLAVAAIVTGFGLAPLYPLTAAFLTALTTASGSQGTGWVFALGALGGGALPWATGEVTQHTGDLRNGFLVPLGGLLLLALLFAVFRRMAPTEGPTPPAR